MTNEELQPADRGTELSMTVLMTPDMANFAGNVHGGTLMKLLDEAAYACASHYAGNYVVTLSVDQVQFKQPIHVGELVHLHASVNLVGRTSVEVGVKVVAEDIQKRYCRHTNSSYITMVAVGEDGRPVPVPPYEPQTSEERRRHRGALLRKKLRSELSQRYAEIHDDALEEQAPA